MVDEEVGTSAVDGTGNSVISDSCIGESSDETELE